MEAIRLVGEGGLDRDEAAALAARDDLAAFAPLYEAHRDAVYRYLRARSRTEDDAVELTAVTFERALGAIHRYAPSGWWRAGLAAPDSTKCRHRSRASPRALAVGRPVRTRGPA